MSTVNQYAGPTAGSGTGERHHHEDIIDGVHNQMKGILEGSDQGIYIYLDDNHKLCNKKFASLLGYDKPEDWAKIADPVAMTVAEQSQGSLIEAYQRAMEKKVAMSLKLTFKNRSGSTIDTDVIMVPMAYKGHTLALHFIQP